MLAFLFIVFATTQSPNVKAAATRNFTLYGSASLGWGSSPTNITSPGPTIVVEQGDIVNLTLISEDGVTHLFFVSYTDALSPNSTEPQSPPITSGSTVYYNFTATYAVGTYKYRCLYHPTLMWGYFQVVQTGTIPELQPLLMLSLLVVSAGVIALAYKRKRQT